MTTKKVVFHSLDDMLEFVKVVEKYPYRMSMRQGRFVVDARSLLSLVNLGFKEEIELRVNAEDCGNLWHDISKYVAA